MAKAHGARVYATAGDDAKVKLCEKLGAERAINYKTEDFEAVVRDLGGADVVLDMVGGPYVQKNLNVLNDHGRCVIIAFQQGPHADLNLMRLMLKRLTLTGATLRSRSNEEKARIAAEVGARGLAVDRAGQGEARDRQHLPARRRRRRARASAKRRARGQGRARGAELIARNQGLPRTPLFSH